MKTPIRNVMFAAASAVGLFAMLIAAPAGAQDEPTQVREPEAVLAAATLPAASPIETARSSSELGRARATSDQAAVVKPRCNRTNRIGKVTITRCD